MDVYNDINDNLDDDLNFLNCAMRAYSLHLVKKKKLNIGYFFKQNPTDAAEQAILFSLSFETLLVLTYII